MEKKKCYDFPQFLANVPQQIKFTSLMFSDVSSDAKPGLFNQKLHFLVFNVFSLLNILPDICKGNIWQINVEFHHYVYVELILVTLLIVLGSTNVFPFGLQIS